MVIDGYKIDCFNSKLVRLKVALATDMESNKKIVSIPNWFNEKNKILGADARNSSFNSKLVRLKVKTEFLLLPYRRVSIPNWCD